MRYAALGDAADQFSTTIEDRQNRIAVRRPEQHDCSRDTRIAMARQLFGALADVEQRDSNRCRVASRLGQHLVKPRQQRVDIALGPAAGDRRPAIAVADGAPRRLRRAAIYEDEAGGPSELASAMPSFPENRPFRRGTALVFVQIS